MNRCLQAYNGGTCSKKWYLPRINMYHCAGFCFIICHQEIYCQLEYPLGSVKSVSSTCRMYFCKSYYRLTWWKRFVAYTTVDWLIWNPLPRLTFINFIRVRYTVRGSMYLICDIVRFSAGADQVSRVTSWRYSCVVTGVLHGHVGGPVERPQIEESYRFNRHNAARSAPATDWLALCCGFWRHCHGVLGEKCMVE